jgi:hypothetical protein
MVLRRTLRRARLLAAAAFVTTGISVSACAFWELDHWSARAGIDASVAFCATPSDGSLFCDDFDSTPVAWTLTQVCTSCTIGGVVPEAGVPPSPPSVLLVDAPATDASPSAYYTEVVSGNFPSVGGEFWAYVERADANGEAALQELQYTVDSSNVIRVRIYVTNATISLGTAVTASSLPAITYTDVASAPFAQRQWHHVVYAISQAGSTHQVTWAIDGAVVTPPQDIKDGDRVVGSATRVDLRNGVFYISGLPTSGGTRVSLDNVRLSSP